MAEIEDVVEAIEDLRTDIMDKLDDILGKNILSKTCNHCDGDGLKATVNGNVPCPDCNGVGQNDFGKIKST